MAIEYALKIREGVVDDRVRDLLIEAYPELTIMDIHSEKHTFDLESALLYVCAFYSQDWFRDLGGYSFQSNCLVWFRHMKHDLHNAALQMLRCVLHLIDHMDNDMVLLWQSETAVLARVGGELMLRQGDDFWTVPERLAMLEGRPYRVARMRL